MSEIRHMISDAARQVGVEAHVLRSWEEELDIKVGRTELGHRYYTDKTIYIMKKVRELREKGFQLKAIKVLIPEIQKKAEDAENEEEETKEETKAQTEEKMKEQTKGQKQDTHTLKQQAVLQVSDSLDNLEKFEEIVGNIVKCALQENNVELENRIADALMLNSFRPKARSSGIISGSLAASPHMPTMMPASRPQVIMRLMLRSTAGLNVEYR